MITSLSWLKNHLFTKANLNQVADRLTEIGLEVENIKSSNNNLDNFIICKIIKLSKLLFDDFIFSTSSPIFVKRSATSFKFALVVRWFFNHDKEVIICLNLCNMLEHQAGRIHKILTI